MLSFIDALPRVQAQHETFFDKNFIKAWFCWGEMCQLCHIISVGWLEIMIQHTPSIICDFHFPLDFRLNILLPHIFWWFLHQNWVGIGGFTLTKFRRVGDEEKTIPSCLDTRSPMMAPPVLLQSAFCALTSGIVTGCIYRVHTSMYWVRTGMYHAIVWYRYKPT